MRFTNIGFGVAEAAMKVAKAKIQGGKRPKRKNYKTYDAYINAIGIWNQAKAGKKYLKKKGVKKEVEVKKGLDTQKVLSIEEEAKKEAERQKKAAELLKKKKKKKKD